MVQKPLQKKLLRSWGGPEANGQLAETWNFSDKWPVGFFLHFRLQWLTEGSGHQTSNEKVDKLPKF